MLKTIIKRVLQIIPMLFIISIISFALIKLAPGDPVNSFVTPDMNPDDVERIRQSLGWINQFMYNILFGLEICCREILVIRL